MRKGEGKVLFCFVFLHNLLLLFCFYFVLEHGPSRWYAAMIYKCIHNLLLYCDLVLWIYDVLTCTLLCIQVYGSEDCSYRSGGGGGGGGCSFQLYNHYTEC